MSCATRGVHSSLSPDRQAVLSVRALRKYICNLKCMTTRSLSWEGACFSHHLDLISKSSVFTPTCMFFFTSRPLCPQLAQVVSSRNYGGCVTSTLSCCAARVLFPFFFLSKQDCSDHLNTCYKKQTPVHPWTRERELCLPFWRELYPFLFSPSPPSHFLHREHTHVFTWVLHLGHFLRVVSLSHTCTERHCHVCKVPRSF